MGTKPRVEFGLERANWPAILVDDTGTIRQANPAAVQLLGAGIEGDTSLLTAVWSPENPGTPEQYLARLERSPLSVSPLKFRAKGGATIAVSVHICPLIRDEQRFYLFQWFAGASVPAVDSTLAQKQKLDCAMQLIRSVVLDFNNALTSILGHTSLLLSKIEPGHPWRVSLVEVEKSAERAAEVAHDLAAFSRQEKDHHSLTAGNLNELLRQTVELFRGNDTPPVAWVLQLETRLYSVNFDEAKMQQVFLKIFENAVQALATNEGEITVQTRNLDIAANGRDGTTVLSAGPYVCVEIKDNGCGIRPELLTRIFEPFFTTKPKHRGLGLAWVYGIVTNHGGSVAVTSQSGAGTTVRVYLPALKRFVKEPAARPEATTSHQTILMVDDENLLLTMGEMVLTEFGYRVLTADSGAKALELFTQKKAAIDLVITDLVMPKMSGRELIEQLRQHAPDVRVICCSGYVRATAAEEEEETYLQKPFTSQDLLRKVKQVLG